MSRWMAVSLALAVLAGCSSGTTPTTTGSSASGPSATGGSGSTGEGGSSAGSSSGSSGGGGSTGTGGVGPDGGAIDRLVFAAVGDTRPAEEDDVANYPSAIISKIFSDMETQSPRPAFVVATGDYMFAQPKLNSTADPQAQLYLQARAAYAGTVFPAMGNHECTGATNSNCSVPATNNNYGTFMNDFLAPLGRTTPYYRFDVNDTAGHWKAKFLVLAMNAWDTNGVQAAWLTTQLQDPTDYTFIVRHEPASADTAPGVGPSDAILAQYPYTAKIAGHFHEFSHSSGSREIVVGNGGAPLASNASYGYALFAQMPDAGIEVEAIDYQTNAPTKTFYLSK